MCDLSTNTSVSQAAYHDAFLMATSFREPTDKLVSNINVSTIDI